jgi:hypothetical protein
LNNQKIDTDDWTLHLIDHSRSFRLDKKLRKGIENEPLALQRWLYENLEEMDATELRHLFRGLMGNFRIKAILARRDTLLEKIERDRALYGDALIFHEAAAEAAQAGAAAPSGSP